MKNEFLTGIVVCCLSVLILLAEAIPVFAIEDDHTVNDAASVIDGIVAWNLKNSDESSAQEWIDGTLTQNAGATSEWYILTLRQSGDYDFCAYEAALCKFLENNEIRSASSRLKYALVLHAIGSTDDYIAAALNNSIGGQGIMNWIYDLHLLNSCPTVSRRTAGIKAMESAIPKARRRCWWHFLLSALTVHKTSVFSKTEILFWMESRNTALRTAASPIPS